MDRNRVFVIGVGMTKFEKPGRRDNFDYPDMVKEAVGKALADGKISYNDVEQAVCGYVYGDSTCGQRGLYEIGMSGIPIYNVNNNCSTGSTALLLGKNLILGGLADCVLAVGFEKMQRGSLSATFTDRANPMERHVEVIMNTFGVEAAPVAAQMFGNAAREHMQKYGTTPVHLAKIAYKNHKHSANNPYSQFQTVYTLQEIMESPKIHDPLTKLQCCPTSDGGAAAILASEEFVRKHHLESQAIEIVAMEMATDLPSTFGENSCMKMVGYDMTRKAAEEVYAKSGLRPDDFQVVELHDCFSANELITYEALGLCPVGEAAAFIDRGDNTYGGKVVVNPSGGLISKGHPLGATGLAQCAELVWQLRGQAGARQVTDVTSALQHNIGLGGAVVVAAYQRGFPQQRLSTAYTKAVPEGYKSARIFNDLKEVMRKGGDEIVKKVNGIFAFKVKGGPDGEEAVWTVDCKNGSGSVEFGETKKPNCTISIGDEDLLAVMAGRLEAQKAFFLGKLKFTGSLQILMKLRVLQSQVQTLAKL